MWGLAGAVWINFIMKWVVAGFAFNECRKIFTFRINKVKLIWLPLVYTLIFLAAGQAAGPGNALFVFLGETLVSIALVFLVYRRELFMLLDQWRRKNRLASAA